MPKRLKPIIDKLEDVEEAYREYYAQRADGKFVLELDGPPPGFVEQSKLDEFRNNNIKLIKDMEELRKKRTLTEEEEKEWAELKKREQSLRDKALIDEGKIEELFEARTANMKKDHEAQVKKQQEALVKATAERDKLNERLASVLIDSKVSEAVSSVGVVRKGAMPDILGRARRTWKVLEGEPVAMQADGETPIYGKDGKSRLTFPEWAEILTQEAGFLFETSTGGGSSGGGKGGREDPNVRHVPTGDPVAFGKNLKDIAEGKVKVVPAAG